MEASAKLIERSGVRTIVLDGNDPERVLTAVRYGDHDGTAHPLAYYAARLAGEGESGDPGPAGSTGATGATDGAE